MAKKGARESIGVKEMRQQIQKAEKALDKVISQILTLEGQQAGLESDAARLHFFVSRKEMQKPKNQKP